MNKLEIFFEKGYDINKHGIIINSKGEFIEGYIHTLKSGYERKEITIRHDKKLINICHHRLQAYKKYGKKIFEKGIMVRHLNGNSLDNNWKNIEIGSNSDNQMDRDLKSRLESSLIASRFKQNQSRDINIRELIYEDLKNNIPYSEIMKKHGVTSKGTLSFMKNKSIEYQEYLTTSTGA